MNYLPCNFYHIYNTHFNIIKKIYLIEYQNNIKNYNELFIYKFKFQNHFIDDYVIIITKNDHEYIFKQPNYNFIHIDDQSVGIKLLQSNELLLETLNYIFINLNKKDSDYKKEIDALKNELFKKDKLNKRLVNILIIYKYHELNNIQKYDYTSIKEKNKKLNSEFRRIAKLMKLNK
jgi:hypothetical protein